MASKKVLTLAFISKGDELLLGLKKRGFGQGRWNGFGGKVHSGETIAEGAKREIFEECGLTVELSDLAYVAAIDFEFKDDPVILEVHVFLTNKFEGEVTESDEMAPKWFSSKELPFDRMWPDDRIWVPTILAGKKFNGYFLFEGFDTILDHKIDVMNTLDLRNDKLVC